MAEYVTEQKRILKKILEDNSDSAYTVEELMTMMKAARPENAPGKSTVYRLITHLTKEGSVKRFMREGTRKFAYQIMTGEHCDSHLHLKCMECGRIFHLDENISNELLGRVKATNAFSVSEKETVLFGTCKSCENTETE